MAGGLGRGAGIPLRDRVRAGTPAEAEPEPPAREPVEVHPGRHCWVSTPVDGPHPRPALLLEWRKVAHRWEGRVVYAAQLRPGRWATVEEWVPAELLTPEAGRS